MKRRRLEDLDRSRAFEFDRPIRTNRREEIALDAFVDASPCPVRLPLLGNVTSSTTGTAEAERLNQLKDRELAARAAATSAINNGASDNVHPTSSKVGRSASVITDSTCFR